jgi:hypothetical protein
MADDRSTNVMPQYSVRASRPRSKFTYVLATLALMALGAFYGLMVVFLPVGLVGVPLAPIGVMFLVFLWLLPDINEYDTKRMTHAFWGVLVVFALWPQYIALAIPGLPWINLLRVALIVAMIWFVGATATASSFRSELIATTRYSKVFFWAFVIFVSLEVLTLPLSSSPFFSLQKLVINLFMWPAMFFLACHVCLRPGVMTRTVHWLIVSVIFICLIGLWEGARQQVPWADHIPSFLQVDASVLTQALSSQSRAYAGGYRVRSVFGNSLVFAEYLIMVLPFILHFILMSKTQTVRVLSIVAYMLLSVNVVLSGSRLGALGWAESHVLYLGIWTVRRFLTRKADLVAGSIAYMFPVMVAAFVALTLVWHRLYVMMIGGGASQSSTNARYVQRNMAIPKVLANPFGNGTGQSGHVLGYVDPSGVTTVDSYFITLLLDYGVIGFLAYFTMIFTAAYVGVRRFFDLGDDDELLLMGPLAVALCNWAVAKLVLSQEQNQLLMFVYLGMMAALATRAALVVKVKAKAPVMVARGWRGAGT